MAQKYKLEEFHDPDYSSQQYSKTEHQVNQQQQKFERNSEQLETTAKHESPNKACTSSSKPVQLLQEQRHKKICDVIKSEFSREITAKKSEIDEITKRITEAKELLAKVRYAVVYNYYSKRNLAYSESEFKEILNLAGQINPKDGSSSSAETSGIDLEKFQPAIHPSLKKLIGERKVDYDEILKARPRRQAAKTATQRFNKKGKHAGSIKLKGDQQIQDNEIDDAAATQNEIKLPRYVPPKLPDKQIEQLNSARGRFQYRHLIAVGNTSKYIGHEEIGSMTNVTHKWLVYVTTKTSVPIENILTKVRFFLHESYKPNDVMEVNSPPFELTRRGWGEFSIRAQLYFHVHLQQKPVQIYHSLVLDKKNSGLQTMGAETIVELWLNIPNKEVSDTEINSVKKESQHHDQCSEKPINSSINTSIEPEPSSKTKLKPIKHESDIKNNSALISNNKTTLMPEQTLALPAIPYVTQLANAKVAPIQRIQNTEQIPEKPIIMSANNSLVTFSNMPNKKFMKCVDKQGKVSFVELLPDPNNPKVFKLVLPNKKLTPSLGSNSIRPMPSLSPIQPTNAKTLQVSSAASTSSTVQPQVPINSSSYKEISVNATFKQPLQATQASSSVKRIVNVNAINNSVGIKNSVASSVNEVSNKVSKDLISPMKPPAETSQVPVNQKCALSSVQGKAVIMKNGKIFIVDKSKAIIQPKLQQSLLKPQVSLLKPTIAENKKQVQVSCPPLSITSSMNNNFHGEKSVFKKNSKITTQNDSTAFSKKIVGVKFDPKQYAVELEERFYKCDHFENVTTSVFWLLRQLPLIMQQEIHGLRDSFPFMVRSEKIYYAMPWGKQRCYEMMRARYIKQLIAKHAIANKLKPEWTIRQIILFGRKFGFTPALRPNLSMVESKLNTASYKDMIKNELIKEHLQNDTISFNHRTKEWLDEADAKLYKIKKENVQNARDVFDSEIIDVDQIANASSSKVKRGFLEYEKEYCNKLTLPVENDMRNEFSWIRDMCRSIQIKIQPEELVEGVMYRAAERMLITALRRFIEDLLRRARSNKTINSATEHHNDITREDILGAIAVTKHFDFMTNKQLGVEKIMSQL